MKVPKNDLNQTRYQVAVPDSGLKVIQSQFQLPQHCFTIVNGQLIAPFNPIIEKYSIYVKNNFNIIRK